MNKPMAVRIPNISFNLARYIPLPNIKYVPFRKDSKSKFKQRMKQRMIDVKNAQIQKEMTL